MDPDSQLGVDVEKKLSLHMKKLQAVGFVPTHISQRKEDGGEMLVHFFFEEAP